MRILIASDSFPPKVDGVSDTASIISGRLASRGHTVRVIAPAPGTTKTSGYRVARIASLPSPLYPELRLAVDVPRIARLARNGHWDGAIVLTPGPIGVSTIAMLPKSVPALNIYTTDIPNYLQTYGLHFASGAAEGLLKWMARRSVATLCPTQFVHAALTARGFPRLEIWGRGVETALFRPDRANRAMRERLTAGSPASPLVLFVGRLAKEKRVADLREAASQLEGVRFAFVGDGPERARLEAAFAGLPVVFTGYLRDEELASAYASADLFVFPSDSETFGQVVLQAMASGVPPIVVADSATAELVPAGIAGLHVAPGRPAAITSAVRRLLLEPGLRNSMSIAATECARRYSWDALAARLEVLLACGPSARTAQSRPEL